MTERRAGHEPEPKPPITVHDLAVYRMVLTGRYAADSLPERYTGADYEAVGLPIFGGCEVCEASVAGYNSCPTRTGYLRCTDCTGDLGYASAEDANEDIFGPDNGR